MRTFIRTFAMLKHYLKANSCAGYVPYSKRGLLLVQHMCKYGFITNYTTVLCWNRKHRVYTALIRVDFLYLHNIKLVYNLCTARTHFYITNKQLRARYAHFKIFFLLSTPYGICSIYDALHYNTGGRLIGSVLYRG